jgi:hypothetical protein
MCGIIWTKFLKKGHFTTPSTVRFSNNKAARPGVRLPQAWTGYALAAHWAPPEAEVERRWEGEKQSTWVNASRRADPLYAASLTIYYYIQTRCLKCKLARGKTAW